MKCLIIIAALIVSAHAITKKEIFNIAKKHTDYPSTILAITGVESSYGVNLLGDDRKSLGIAQVQIPTALFLATKDKSLAWLLSVPKKKLETLLLRNDAINIEIASKLFEYHRKRHGYVKGIMLYNGGMKNWKYYNKVRGMMR